LLEYGGWGIKYGRKGKAYNVSGNRGVQLVFKDGKQLLIGSQRAEELAEAISSIAITP
jgi:TATA-box binding protein (TBP) (component of TFIID and TFIIIB)